MKRIGFIDARRIAGFTFPATATPGNGQVMNITDPSIIASGTNRGSYILYRQTGAKTGTGRVDAHAVDLVLSAAVPYAYAHSIYMAHSGDPTIGHASGITMYIDNLGSGLSSFAAIDIGLSLSDVPPGRHCFIRMRNHAGQPVTDGIRIESTHPLTNLFYFFTTHEPIVAAAVGATNNHKIRVRINTTPYYIPLYTS